MTTTARGHASPPGPARASPAAAPPAHRPRPRWWRAFEFWLANYRRTWRGSVFSSFLAPLLYIGSLGYGLGSLVDSGGEGRVAGVPYALFVAPGVLAAAAMQTGVGEATYPVTGAVKWQRQYHAMLATPLTVSDVLLGHAAFLVLRVALASAAFLVVGAALGAFASPWAVLALPVAVLCGAAHALPVMAYAVRTDNEQGFTMIFRFGVVPMFLFAGTFFPVDRLPAAMQPLAWATPLWHATALCRDLALETARWLPSLGHLAYLVLWLVVGGWLARGAYRRRLVD